jgi:NAD(P)-dependent dehydrogenase (short-subunit alcohol dehydrogenase family)
MPNNVLITGATGGIGFHVAAAIAATGARTIVTGRDRERGDAAVAQLREVAGHERVELIVSDGASIGDTRALADEVRKRMPRLDLLVANVGGLEPHRSITEERLERTLAVNFVAPMLLSNELAPLLEASAASRLVHVSSTALEHVRGDPFADLQASERYVGFEALARAKLLDVSALLALARRVERKGVVVTAVNPGMAWTPATQALTPEAVPSWRWIWPIVRWFQKRAKPEAAARWVTRVACGPDAPTETGRFYDEGKVRKLPAALLTIEAQERAFGLAHELAANAGAMS